MTEFDSPLYAAERSGQGPVLPLSLQAAVKPIIEMLAVVQARLRMLEVSLKHNVANNELIVARMDDLANAVWALDLRNDQQD